MSHNYKLLVIDIDGTLVDGNKSISIENREALVKVRDLGMQVSLSTGRSLKACLRIIEQLSLDNYHISFDGALVSSPELGEEIYVQPISRVVVKQMVEFAHEHGMDLELYTSTHYFAERETWSTEAHRQFFGVYPTMVDFTNIWERERILKGGVVPTTPQEEAQASAFYRQFDDSLHFSQARTPAYPDIVFINVLAPEVSKGKGTEALAAHLGVPLSEVVAVGDGSNDVSLLSSAGLAIAMGNARSEVKAVADYITLDVDHSGLAVAINKFLL
ncbi:Cof-type HAD-IIB family hydrolase [Chloroflexota bacterium]